MIKNYFLLAFISLLISQLTFSQQIDFKNQALHTIQLKADNWQLTGEDVSDIFISDAYTDEHNGVTHIYAQQTIDGILIHNALITLNYSEKGDLIHSSSRFVPAAKSKLVSSRSGKITELQAIRHAFNDSGIDNTSSITAKARRNAHVQVFQSPEVLQSNILANQAYFKQGEGLVHVWDISFFPKDGLDYLTYKISVEDGSIVDKSSFTNRCNIEHIPSGSFSKPHNHDLTCMSSGAATEGDGAQYRVFSLPTESPFHGPRELIFDPADPIASPFGWHDINGEPGHEYTTTRGNNVWAKLDRDGNYNADEDVDGTDLLIFDFPYDTLGEPIDYIYAATTNLFYVNNMMHDVMNIYGFTEEAGNFQDRNYSGEGMGNDFVNAYAQFGAQGTNINNADFSTPPDGGSGQMRMFLWNRRDDISVFSVTAPEIIKGVYPASLAEFGAQIDTNLFTGEVVFVDDGSGVTSDACQPIINGNELAGKIAMIDRGDCEFGFKILNAEEQGAIGAIICNNIGTGLVQMGAGIVGNQVTIPSVFLTKDDCARIRVYAGDSLTVTFQLPDSEGPTRVDGSLDNGIIAHEYGHGISNRLTGGPSQASCLNNYEGGDDGEQMGEGWSDYFTLIMTVKPEHDANTPRGVGTYALRQEITGNGIRSYPYSRDMNINPVTLYDTYEASVPHGVGHVWSSVLWDLYWDLVDEHGYDENRYNAAAGNNIAIQLVMDGMKMQPCDPGFLDGRDAILAADIANNAGENQGIIWKAFARRGMGWKASQGSNAQIRDAKESYEIPPQFIPTVKVNKSMTPLIVKGDNIVVNLEIRNDMDTAVYDLTLTDLIPNQTEVDMGTLPADLSLMDDQVILALDSLGAGEIQMYSYELITPDIPSRLIVLDDFEDLLTELSWIPDPIEGFDQFIWTNTDANSGEYSWRVTNTNRNNEQVLFNIFPTTASGSKPVLRVSHKYNTEAGTDAGLIEISIDAANTWSNLEQNFIRNGYNNHVLSSAFGTQVSNAFSGNSQGWIDSYVDLGDYVGEDTYFRFHFSSNDSESETGWNIDDFTVFDALNYNSQVCVDYNGSSESICAEAPEWGTIVEPEEFVSIDDELSESFEWIVHPNPAGDWLYMEVKGLDSGSELAIQLADINGRIIWNKSVIPTDSRYTEAISMSDLQTGMYILGLKDDSGTVYKKVIKK
jgi:hypothetical protein